MGCDHGLCCSGGLDAQIRCWRLPDLDMDPYDGYDPGVLCGVLEGHGDAMWGLCPPLVTVPMSPDPGVLCGVLEGHRDIVWGLCPLGDCPHIPRPRGAL
ncbi:striatin-4-like, partial [Corapipo altera]|uniref:striatin-4-like n=1 Tax=Corapipo altera TaxID=415028 RepID=UPI000FD6A078